MKHKKIYFVGGCPRSATSAFSWALAEHTDLTTSAESNFLFYLLRDVTGNPMDKLINKTSKKHTIFDSYEIAKEVSDGWFNKHEVTLEDYLAYMGEGVKKMFMQHCDTDIFLEQSPENILIVDKLLLMFPDAKVINMIRDGREVVSSMLKSGFSAPWSKDFKLACETWNHFAKKGYEFSQKYPNQVINVYQKDLVYDTENAVRKVFRFFELDFESNTVEYLQTKRVNSSYGNDEKNNFKTAKDPALLKQPQWEKWTNKEKKQFENIAGETMALVGLS
ncbi:sulfotransferase [Sulfurimonas sp. SWIR-19]|uniref:sulfotransferase family protein n=1 Tax=Sulfurimonas sp. SWIR-19 TaxID=2878390 RepID=UPI001CF27852|nr:sulfotransferase [Sulfurimonas sp. SWIR-19]UCN00604.1 sulfotransferase [Sulfurimonas sp. SWIR-19]